MATLLLIGNFLISPLAIPLWGALTALSVHLFGMWRDSKKLSLDEREQNREDFRVIKDSLRDELDHVKAIQVETTRQVELAKEDTEKCEQRYFELATQYRELLKYCANLARTVRDLESQLKIHVFKEEVNGQKHANPADSGPTNSVPGQRGNEEVI